MAKKNKAPIVRRRRQRQEVSAFGPLFFTGLAAIGFISWQVAVLVAFGLVPTIVLAFTGKGSNKSLRLQCVTFANLSGVIAFVPQVWSRPTQLEAIVTDPINLVMMWGSASIGYMLIYVGPIVATHILQGMAQDKIKQITQQRQALVEAWGPEVLGDKDDAPKPNHIRPKKS